MSRSTRTAQVRGATITLWLAGTVLSGISCRDSEIAGPGDRGATEVVSPLTTAVAGALSFRQVSTGGGVHTCGVTTDDHAYCWGTNGNGALGDGTTTDRLTPVLVAGGLTFRQVRAGFSYTCGVATDDRTYCWGYNQWGQLGDGTTTTRLEPTAVLSGRQFRRVSPGDRHTCGVTSDDRVYCWGYNRDGELGDGTTTDRLGPVAVLGGLTFRHVSAGNRHTCGLTPTSEAYCWGTNQGGQLGDSTEVGRRLKPVLVVGGRHYRQLDAGGSHTCAWAARHREDLQELLAAPGVRRAQLQPGERGLSPHLRRDHPEPGLLLGLQR
jgi:alpha-tubulin suppressor-like RCC1 family protein